MRLRTPDIKSAATIRTDSADISHRRYERVR
jgi:hypothetical protein